MASSTALSKTYHQRLKDVLESCNPAEIPSYNYRFSRRWFAEKIGCSTNTLSTSLRLRAALVNWEQQQRPIMVSRSVVEDEPANVVPFRRRTESIIMPVSLEIGKGTFTVPTLIWRDGIDEWVADFARHLIVREKKRTSSVEETVKVLRMFRSFQRAHHVPHEQVNDDFLLAWQSLKKGQKVSVGRSNYCISVVHDFYKWAESFGRLKYHVQTKPKHDYIGIPEDYIFPISGQEVELRLPNGQKYIKWVSGLLDPGVHSSYGSRHTPTPTEVTRLFAEAKKEGRNSARNLLMLVVALETGARVSEIVQLKVGQFPTTDKLGRFIGSKAEPYLEVEVERKNQGKGRLRINQQLVLKVVAYIYGDNQRLSIVRKKHAGTQSNEHCVFLSESGKGITTDSVTRIAGQLFQAAGIEKANIHRLRARYITTVIELQLDRLAEQGITVNRSEAWEEQVLVMAVQLMGHSHPMSLRPYLNEILQRRMTKEGRIAMRSAEQIEQSVAEISEQFAAQIFEVSQLAQANQLIIANKKDEAMEVLSGLLKKMQAVGVA
ncbi:site-specific integrase [Agrobacterium sp. SHOUNA12C]|nr:site-specific integrase [Agrobacterium sp. BETTINA12B]MCJ9755450.1 site-specific integrase [Agrobacterium sp. SHOUNA12C]NTG34844.1 site-specific integrase [Rhizobium rhizogenes]NTG54093.1 site-specific integrase [Rhizobium rhizogenes]NTH51618.1 site-specific integrase [Rhizobium rhizogenes]